MKVVKKVLFSFTIIIVILTCVVAFHSIDLAYAARLAASVKVKYFFSRDGKENPEGQKYGKIPNWFYYWNQFLPQGIAKKYDWKIKQLYYVKDADDGTLGTILGNSMAVTMRDSRETLISQIASESGSYDRKGIHTYCETLVHENHHLILCDSLWPHGYDKNGDVDKDGYPDDWERNNTEAHLYGFRPPGTEYDYMDAYVIPSEKNHWYKSPGYEFEEASCNTEANNAKVDLYDSQDWSYDSTGKYQGKMWLKLP